LALLTLEDVSAVEEEEIRRAYEMASIPLGDEEDDGFDVPQGYEQHMPAHHSHPTHVPVHHQHQHQQMAPPPPPPQHYNIPPVPQSAPAHIAHHQVPTMGGPQPSSQHIPAFDGPTMFPGPGHHHSQQPHPHAQVHGMNGGMVFGQQQQQPQQYGNTSPGVSGSPPHTGQFAGYPRPGSQQSYTREHQGNQFAHVPPHRDDDSTSGSSAGGSPPATGHSQFSSGGGSFAAQQEVPTLAAGATPADFARFWAGTSPHHAQNGVGQKMGMGMGGQQAMGMGAPAGFAPMGFAM
jgi:hypothetical protein